MKTAIITGITGQDAAYLSKLLINKNYRVVGLTRGNTNYIKNLSYLDISDDVVIEKCDLLNICSISEIIKKYKPDEIYNLAAQSSVGLSFENPSDTLQFNITSVMNILEVIRTVRPDTKLYQASSSEMFGKVVELPITGDERYHPLSPYAVSKVSAHLMAKNYRDSYGLFVSTGILFNHESYLRKDNFFIKKVIRESINIKKGIQKQLVVGNIDIRRDFGYAPKYVEAMYLMLQKDNPDDYIVCSGESVSLREIIYYVFQKLDISKDCLIVSESLFRPLDILDIYGDNSRTKELLSWEYDLTFWQVLDILLDEELVSYSSSNSIK